MTIGRRAFITAGGVSSLLATTPSSALTEARETRLPDRSNFPLDGIYLDAAYTHALGRDAVAAGAEFLEHRARRHALRVPGCNARNDTVSVYARLINAAPEEIAVVPSALEGENIVGEAIGLGRGAGVVTDCFHYDASLVRYGEMARAGMPLVVLRSKDNRIDYDALDAAITPDIRLVALSSVSGPTGYRHDLKRVCAIAHAKGAMVYADVIQEVGAIPLDVRESGVDFCCAGLYKWLMGDFGAAFLYVRPDRLSALKRGRIGWRGVEHYVSHTLPGDPPGPAVGDWVLGRGTAGLIEVSTPAWGALATSLAGLRYIERIGVANLDAYRRPMLARLQDALPRAGWSPLTPRDAQGPTVAFAQTDAKRGYAEKLASAGILISIYEHRIRISPSVYNDLDDIERLLAILTRPA